MTNFGSYSAYYDLLYADKNYVAETDYVAALVDRHATLPGRRLLDVGCGTGLHACELAVRNFEVFGLDLSDEMLARAQARATNLRVKNPDMRVGFQQGNATNFELATKFDIVTSLFHVLSYQTTDAELAAMLANVSRHLESGGLFLFDFWYGPAVLWQRPTVRVKRLTNAALEVLRVAEPVLHSESNVVDVKYSIYIGPPEAASVDVIHETHRMRYFFLPEIESALAAAGLRQLVAEEWLTGGTPSCDAWGICIVAVKG